MPSTSKASNKLDYTEWARFKFIVDGLRIKTGESSRSLSRRLFGSKGYLTHSFSHRSIVGEEDLKKVEALALQEGVPIHPPLLDNGRIPEGREEVIQAMAEVDALIQPWPDFLPSVQDRAPKSRVSAEEADLFYALIKSLTQRGVHKTDIAVEYAGYSSIGSLYYTLNNKDSLPALQFYKNLVINFAKRHGTSALRHVATGGNGVFTAPFPEEPEEEVEVIPRASVPPKPQPQADTFGSISRDLEAILGRLNNLSEGLPKGMADWLKASVIDPIHLATLELEPDAKVS